MIVKIVCRCCDKEFAISCSPEGYKKWKGGELIQTALPQLSPSTRELLMTRICGKCWNKILN